ncbi:MAG: PD-(D/E)XK nuclease family protein [Thermoanaerobaculia bacterium]|nr:PD-(D/E)XK nuclease family protein [Thermoanaerobaculia bacterium]
MPPRFDAERRAVELAVADLLDPTLLRSLGFAHRGGFERLWLGQAIHSRYQEEALAADPTYRREVTLRHTFDHRGWEVTLSGRADGLRRDPDGALVVEEIKSVRRGAQLSAAARELYARQARLYAWMLSELEGTEARAELVLIEIGGEGVEREALATDLAALALSVRQRLNSILGGFERAERQRADRRAAAGELRFPYRTLRAGQEEIVAAVERAMEQGEHLLLEAPTGIGKTAAALFPVLRHALAHDRRVFVLTAKTLQQTMAMTVCGLLNASRAFHALQLRAKAKMCANGEVICHEEYCPYARDYYGKLATSGLVPRLLGDWGELLPDEVFAAARTAEVCPFETSLELAGAAEVVVCDYNYAFDPWVALEPFAPDAHLGDTVLVIDEIHNLVERGRGYLSPELAAASARRAALELEGAGSAPLLRRNAELCRELAGLVDGAVDSALALAGGEAAESALPEDLLWRLRPEFDTAFVDYLEHQRETKSFRAEDAFVGLYFELLRFLSGLMERGPAFSHLVERREEGGVLRVLCKDPSRHLGAVLARAHAVVGLSATLSPPEFYRDLLGFDPARTSILSLPSPFPAAHRRLVLDASVSTAYRDRSANARPLAERLAAFVDEIDGNCLVLFPSFLFLQEVAGFLRPRRKRVLLQQRHDGDREREALLEALRGAVLGDVALLAVAGGVFAEGVDYPGEMLRAVAVVGPCLPVPTVETRLLQQYYEERFERGFEFAFVVPGMTRVVQAAGRLIRSPEDRGVIALFDKRFLHRPYRDRLPADWLPEEGVQGLVGDPDRVAAEFFAAAADPGGPGRP